MQMSDIKNTMVKKIENQFSPPSEINKRQISVFLAPETVDALDQVVEQIKKYSNKKITRNSVIEIAVETLIESAPEAINHYEQQYKIKNEENFDTVIFPSDITGIDTLTRTKSWFYVRVDKNKIDKLKFLGLYIGVPIQAVTHVAEIDHYEEREFNGKIKYIFYIKDKPIELENPVKLGSINPQATRSPKFTRLTTLKKAKEFKDL